MCEQYLWFTYAMSRIIWQTLLPEEKTYVLPLIQCSHSSFFHSIPNRAANHVDQKPSCLRYLSDDDNASCTAAGFSCSRGVLVSSVGESFIRQRSCSPADLFKLVWAERPVLLVSTTIADCVAWEEAWQDYSSCHHVSDQDHMFYCLLSGRPSMRISDISFAMVLSHYLKMLAFLKLAKKALK